MSNYQYNKLLLFGDENEITNFFEFIKQDTTKSINRWTDNLFDFNSVIPLNGSIDDNAVFCWGTRCNAFDVEKVDDCIISFTTTPNTPTPVLMKLSEIYSDLTMILCYENESYPNEVHVNKYHNGKLSVLI